MEALSPEDLLRFETLTDEECKKELQKLITVNLQSAIANQMFNFKKSQKRATTEKALLKMSHNEKLWTDEEIIE